MAPIGPTPREGPAAEAVETARRQRYRPGGGAGVDEYERGHRDVECGGSDGSSSPGPRRSAHRLGRRTRSGLTLVGVVALMVGAVVLAMDRDAEPRHLDPPALAGDTIAAYGRAAETPRSADRITYQPEGYTVFQAAGRVVHLAFRCVGSGSVRLFAGTVHRFRCTDHEALFERSDGVHQTAPFMIVGSTKGDVVWSVRVVLRDR